VLQVIAVVCVCVCVCVREREREREKEREREISSPPLSSYGGSLAGSRNPINTRAGYRGKSIKISLILQVHGNLHTRVKSNK
jgi:hypothetical protein